MLNNWYQHCRNLEEALNHWDQLSEIRLEPRDEYSEYYELVGIDRQWLEEMGIKW